MMSGSFIGCSLETEWKARSLNIKISNTFHKSMTGACSSNSGVISRGAQGPEPSLLKCLFILGGSAPLEFLHWLSFSEFIGLASKVLWLIVHCYTIIDASLIVDYTISVLN